MPMLNDINLEDVERIEVVRGPGSTVYGSNALGGVVNIVTRKGLGAAKPVTTLGVEAGSHGRIRTAAAVRGQSGNVDYSFSALRESENGISAQDTPLNGDNDAWRNQQLQGSLGLRLAKNVRLEYFGRYSVADEEYDMADATWGPFKDTGDIANQRWTSGLRLAATDLFDGLLDSSLAATVSDLRRGYRDDDGWSWNDGFSGRTVDYGWQNTLHLHERVDLTLGVDQVQESAKVDDGGNPAWGIAPSTPVDDRHRTTAVFGELQVEPVDNLFLNGGARWNNHSVFGHEWTWTAAAAYHFVDSGTRLKTSVGKAYRAPSLYELYEPQYGSPSLGPETGTSWDAGFEQDLCGDRITCGSSYFRNRVTDYIGFDMTTWTYDQVSGVKTNGVESFVRSRPLDDLTLQFTHTYQHTNTMEQEASPLAFAPRHKGSADITWRPFGGPWTLNLNGTCVGHVNTLHGGGAHLDAYTLANAAVTYRVREGLEVYGRVQNLLNENYEVAPRYNEYDRVYYVGMKASF
jgi:vitamin B12 transporter